MSPKYILLYTIKDETLMLQLAEQRERTVVEYLGHNLTQKLDIIETWLFQCVLNVYFQVS